MQVTKHHQSALVLAKDDGGRLAIDLGSRPDGPYDLAALGPLDAVLYTHRHADHLDLAVADALLDAGVPLYGNADVLAALGERPATRLDDGAAVQVAGWEVLPRDLPHVVMVDGSPGPPNTGMVLDGRLFHPGDGMEVEGIAVDLLAVPIAGPSISLHDAYRMVQRLRPTTVLPIHHDVFPADPQMFADRCDLATVVVLGPGETATF